MRIYISNLSYTLQNDSDLEELLEYFGLTPINVKLITTPDGQPRGFGFAEAEDGQAFIKAIDGRSYAGRTIHAAEAQSKPSGNWR